MDKAFDVILECSHQVGRTTEFEVAYIVDFVSVFDVNLDQLTPSLNQNILPCRSDEFVLSITVQDNLK